MQMLRQFLVGAAVSACNIMIHALVMIAMVQLLKTADTKDPSWPWLGCRRDFRVKMWGTSSPDDKLTGDLGNVIETTQIGGRRSDRLTAGKFITGQFWTFTTISARSCRLRRCDITADIEGRTDMSRTSRDGRVWTQTRHAPFLATSHNH
jgi:hypothetical protein